MREQARWLRIRTVRLGALVLLAVAFVLGLAAWGRWAGVAYGQGPLCAVYPIALHRETLAGKNPGDILLDIEMGVESGQFGWLRWKGAGQQCPGEDPNPNSANTLGASLTYPGNSTTCEPCASCDNNQCWKGYLNPDDSDADYECYDPDDDYEINVGDWVWGHTGAIGAISVLRALDEHIEKGHTLRIIVWDEVRCEGKGPDECKSGSNVQYKVYGFALVKLLDYSTGQKTITMEFRRWDNSCGQGGWTGPCDPYVDLYVSQTGNYGQEQTVNLAVFGPASCTVFGDAYSPDSSPWWAELRGVYHFRLNIPPDYESRAQTLTETYNEGDVNSVVRVEIWDPDCYNAPGDSIQIEHSATGEMLNLPCVKPGRQEPCTPETGDPGNPFAFLRIDENRSGTPGTNSGCSTPGNYEWDYNTTTKYTLYYYRVLRGGTLERVNLAGYTKGGEQNDDDTDLLWVCPGGSLPDDPTDVDFGSFEVDIPDDIYASPDGVRSFFLEIETLDGASENGFDLWAGPRYPHVPSEVNERNLFLLENVGDHDSAGATWFGIGHLPQNSNSPVSHVLITLAYVPPEWEGRTVVVSGFDHEPGLTERLTFTIDTTPDWQVPVSGTVFVDGNWHTHKLALPGAPTHTFYGGYLQVWYDAKSQHDTFGWKITTEAIPKLVE